VSQFSLLIFLACRLGYLNPALRHQAWVSPGQGSKWGETVGRTTAISLSANSSYRKLSWVLNEQAWKLHLCRNVKSRRLIEVYLRREIFTWGFKLCSALWCPALPRMIRRVTCAQTARGLLRTPMSTWGWKGPYWWGGRHRGGGIYKSMSLACLATRLYQ